MIKNNKILFLAVFSIFCGSAAGQNNEKKFSVSVNYNYTTTSKLYLQPKSADEFLRGIHSFLDYISGAGIEFRYKISDGLYAGLSTEYLEKKGKITTLTVETSRTENLLVDDGYRVIPVELTGYYVFPFSLQDYKFFMGGGIGFYFGTHIREIGDIKAETLNRETAFGIHIMVGMDYIITDYLSVRGSMKFRDVEFTMYNKYNRTEGTLNDSPVRVLAQDFDSKVAVDGITFSIGVTFQL